MKLACGANIDDDVYSGLCRDRVEAVMKNLCLVSVNDSKAAAELLTAVRFKKGMTQIEMAKLEGISRQAVSARIKRSRFLSALNQVAKLQRPDRIVMRREARARLVYEMYMSSKANVTEIRRRTGERSVGKTARKYAEKHGLPFVQRTYLWRKESK